MVFFIWRLWKFKVLIDDRVRRWGVEGSSRCWCCANLNQEGQSHVFLRYNIAKKTWSYFFPFAGLKSEGLSLSEVFMLWWGSRVKKDIKPYYKAIPSIIV